VSAYIGTRQVPARLNTQQTDALYNTEIKASASPASEAEMLGFVITAAAAGGGG